ncbi:3100_t:CDS:2 [Funneliformis caledonium]|uniref:3100_t:CDS:1 n=1 Tax=Funneliformis caledonium TaxID=1117310 RepID=A0A9N9H007_9GLOM|nr:3100_t:CDS:2 [Funneliformis caledonium]
MARPSVKIPLCQWRSQHAKSTISNVEVNVSGELMVIFILSPDTSNILSTRLAPSWNYLSNADRKEAYPSVAPNYIVELRSGSYPTREVIR